MAHGSYTIMKFSGMKLVQFPRKEEWRPAVLGREWGGKEVLRDRPAQLALSALRGRTVVEGQGMGESLMGGHRGPEFSFQLGP